MTREEMLQDLAYARTLAEEGRHAPLLGGAYLLFWAVLNACAFTAHWAQVTGRLPLGADWGYAVIWASYGVIAGVGMTLLSMRVRKKPGLTTIGARAERALWMGVGAAVLAVALGSIGRMAMTGDVTAPNVIIGAAFALYGMALFAVANLSGHLWLRGFGWFSVGVAGTLCLFANEPWAYLVAAAGSLIALGAPGLVLLKREPAPVA